MSLEENNSWKDIKDIMAGLNGPPTQEEAERTVVPIYAHVSAETVKLNEKYIEAQELIDKTDVFKGAIASLKFNYLIYAFRQLSSNPKNLITIEYVISEEGNERDPFIETYKVPTEEEKLIIKYISTPFRVFDNKDSHKKILLFKEQCPMTLDSFKELIKTWAKP